MRWLIRLYPARWRYRYGAELDQLVRDLQPSRSSLTLAADLAKGALAAHIHEGFDMHQADRRAIRRGALIAGVVWLGLAVEIVLMTVVFPAGGDSISAPLSYLGVFTALALTGALAARDGAGRRGQLFAGLVAGAAIGALTAATFAVVDNAWFEVVSRQQTKVAGFAESRAAARREHINDTLIGASVFLTVGLAAFGAVMSLLGGMVAAGRPRANPQSKSDQNRSPAG